MNVEKRIEGSKNPMIKRMKYKYLIIAFSVLLLILLIDFRPWNNEGLFLYFVDVGQGDCIVVKDYNYTFMIDGGGDRFMDDDNNIGKKVVFPFLLEKGIRKLDCVFITHVHYDHIKGIIEVIDLVDIDTIVLPKVYEVYYHEPSKEKKLNKSTSVEDNDSFYDEDFVNHLFKGGEELFLLEELFDKAVANNIKLLFIDEGQVITGKSSKFTCVYPYSGKTYSDHENENSLILKLELGSVTALLTGDVEDEGEEWLISHKKDLKNINILKVPHHGSNSSSSEELLLQLNPNVAIVSVGENLFGHPSDIVKIRYKNLNIPFYSTKKYGMIEIIVKEEYYKIESYKGELINESFTRTIED